MTFDPNLTQRVKAKARARIVRDWRTRLLDYSTWGISIALLCELVLPIWGDLIPHEIRSVITKTALTFAAIGKFVVQGNVPGLPAANPPKDST